MSAIFKTQGGSGGFFPSIFVTGLSETDTVYASKDGRTVRGKWVTKDVAMAAKIPAMTSNTAPSGVVSASSNYPDRPAYHAFDDNNSTLWTAAAGSAASETYVQYEFERTVSINSVFVSLVNGFASGYENVTIFWVMQGSVDGVAWENISEEQSHVVSVDKTYNLRSLSNKAFKYVRLQVTGGSNGKAHEQGKYSLDVASIQVDAFYTEPVDGFLISPLPELGMWTVTATNGEKTVTQDVLVDVITQYEIELYLNRLYLYREGDECEDVTGGWLSYTRNAQPQHACFQTQNEIDTTAYTEIHILFEKGTSEGVPTVGVSSTQPSSAFEGGITKWGEATGNLGLGNLAELVISLDEATQRSGYITIGNFGYTSRSSTMTAEKKSDCLFTQHYVSSAGHWTNWYDIWLEK